MSEGAKVPKRGMFPLIVAWAMIAFGIVSVVATLSSPKATVGPDPSSRPCPTLSAPPGQGPVDPNWCHPTPSPTPTPTTDEVSTERRVIGGGILLLFGALLLLARAAFIPRN